VLDSYDYIEPGDRPAAWAAMAHEYVAQRRPRDEIAYALCVDEPTLDRLLATGSQEQQPERASARNPGQHPSRTAEAATSD
jgi:hypothetical protein